jgi:predicted DNA-binding protein with PD1-like motif
MHYRPFDGGWILRLETGEPIQESLAGFCRLMDIGGGSFTAIGAVRWARIGYYDQEKGAYREQRVEGGWEVVSLSGNISRKSDGSLFPHAHCILSDSAMKVVGGHLFEAEVGPTLECYLRTVDVELHRIPQPDSPLELLDLG